MDFVIDYDFHHKSTILMDPTTLSNKRYRKDGYLKRALPELKNHFSEQSPLTSLKVKSCAVVGSSSKLLDKEFGEEISNHDYIIRFNKAPIVGYERHVGNRTDARLLGRNWIFQEKDEIMIHRYNSRKYMHVDISNDINKDLYAFNILFMDVCNNNLKNFSKKRGTPSSGFMGVMMAISICSNISLYGFWNPETDSEKEYHYYPDSSDNGKKKGTVGPHNFSEERNFYEYIIKNYLKMNLKIRE